jgi:hypothetical protein
MFGWIKIERKKKMKKITKHEIDVSSGGEEQGEEEKKGEESVSTQLNNEETKHGMPKVGEKKAKDDEEVLIDQGTQEVIKE